MLKIGAGKRFLEELRKLDERLRKIKINTVVVDRETKDLKFNFICDKAVDKPLEEKMFNYLLAELPASFRSVSFSVRKIVSDKELIERRIVRFARENYPSVCSGLKESDVSVDIIGENVRYMLSLSPSAADYFKANGAFERINADLDRNFCDNFSGLCTVRECAEDDALPEDSVMRLGDVERVEHRAIRVTDVIPIDDAEQPADTAVYIEDATSEGEVTLCGRIVGIREKFTQKGKPFYIFDLDDTTGRIGGLYFTRAATLAKIQQLKEGDAVITEGFIDRYNGNLSYKIRKINRCTFPEHFEKVQKSGRSAASEYVRVFPQPVEEVKETDLFSVPAALPAALTENEFVVFDLETTGTDYTVDKITEIGAVRIRGGVITESFTTLVNPERLITEKITQLTGIDNDMVKDATTVEQVAGDFFKFTRGAVLVAHNADFDTKFIKFYSKPLEYFYTNKVVDTVQLAREVLPNLVNHKLNTVCEHFHIEFRHHRAFSDALATAEMFMELVKMKKTL